MPVITGSEITLAIDNASGTPVDYTPQATSVEVNYSPTQEVFETLAGPVYKTTIREYEVTVEFLADWGETGGLCEALEAAFDTDPDAPLDFEAVGTVGANATTISGKVYPKVPPMNATGNEVSTVSVTLIGDVNTALTVVTAATA
jgi:hypothetical protein